MIRDEREPRQDGPAEAPGEIGEQLRRVRQARRLSLRELAAMSGTTASFLSQFERGESGATLATLMRIAEALGLTVPELFAGGSPVGRVVRRGQYPELLPQAGHSKLLLSQPPLGSYEVYLTTLDPGTASGEAPYVHGDSDQLVFVTTGSLEVVLGEEVFLLGPEDSIEFRSSVPHLMRNPGAEPCAAVVVLSPVVSPRSGPAAT